MAFKASSRQDLFEAALRIDHLQTEEKVIFLTNTIQFGLMNAPVLLNIVLKGLKATRGRNGLLAFFKKMYARPDQANILAGMIADTRAHLFNGKDTEDKDSVGGFSQRELDLLFKDIRF